MESYPDRPPPPVSPRIPPPPLSPRPPDCPPPPLTPSIEIEPPPPTHTEIEPLVPPPVTPDLPSSSQNVQPPGGTELPQEIPKKGLLIPESPQENWRRQKAVQRVVTALATSSVKSLAHDTPPPSGRMTLRGRRNSFSDLASLITDFIPPPPLSPAAPTTPPPPVEEIPVPPPPVLDDSILPPPLSPAVAPATKEGAPTTIPDIAPPPRFGRENAILIEAQSVVSSTIAGHQQHTLARSNSMTELETTVFAVNSMYLTIPIGIGPNRRKARKKREESKRKGGKGERKREKREGKKRKGKGKGKKREREKREREKRKGEG